MKTCYSCPATFEGPGTLCSICREKETALVAAWDPDEYDPAEAAYERHAPVTAKRHRRELTVPYRPPSLEQQQEDWRAGVPDFRPHYRGI